VSRHYDSGRLISIECDQCGALVTPNPRIAESGWMKCGAVQYGTTLEWDYCPAHASIAEQFNKAASPRPDAGDAVGEENS
jgi:hypothetical protein